MNLYEKTFDIWILSYNCLTRSFSYQIEQQPITFLGTLDDVNYLCDEGIHKGKRFTGAMFGIYTYDGNNPFSATFTDPMC